MKNSLDFSSFSTKISDILGSFWCFLFAFFSTTLWLITGPLYHFSSDWQLVINTTTNVITFLMVFIIQHSQNRDIIILNIKLDELIRSHTQARNSSIDLSKLSDKELHQLEKEYQKICHQCDQ